MHGFQFGAAVLYIPDFSNIFYTMILAPEIECPVL